MTLAYRVFAYDSSAAAGESGHPHYLYKPQGKGRIDNPGHYDLWYLAEKPEAAIGEVFGDLPIWSEAMFETPYLPSGKRVLGVFDVPDDVALLDLDDANNLLEFNLRPTQVVARNRPSTQAWALRIFKDAKYDGTRKWAGIKWWSFQRPHWTVYGLWVPPGETMPHTFLRYEELDLHHTAVQDAGRSLTKQFR